MPPNHRAAWLFTGAYLFIGLALSSAWSPLVQWLDSPALSVAASHLGIAHPPGEPLFANLSHIVRFVPLGSLPLRLCLLAVVVWFFSVHLLSAIFFPKPTYQGQGQRLAIIALISFSFAVWTQLIRQELYLWNLLFFALALTIHFLRGNDRRSLYLLGYLTMLAAATHTLLAAVGVGAIFCLQVTYFVKMKKLSLSHFLWLGLFVLTGASAQLYLPLRALREPVLNYGDPSTLSNFLWVVTARLYSSYDHVSVTRLYENLVNVSVLYLDYATPLVALLALVGWWRWVKTKPPKAWVILLLIALSVVAVLPNATLDLSNPDLFGYLLPGLLLFFMAGLGNALRRANRWMQATLLILLMVYLLVSNSTDLKIYATPESDRYALAAVSSLPYKTNLSLGSYHSFSQLLYARAREGLRPDLCLNYRGDRRGGAAYSCQAQSNWPATWPEKWYEPGIVRNRLGDYTTRESPALLTNYLPNGMFLAPQSISPSPTNRFEKQSSYWEGWFPAEIFGCGRPLHPGIRRQLSLAHYLHGKTWQAHHEATYAEAEFIAACLDAEGSKY